MTNNRILITGASGFTGKHACRYFASKGMEVYGAVRKGTVSTIENVNEVRIDLSDKDAIDKVVKDVKPQYLLHLAGQNNVKSSWVHPVASFETNTLSTLYLLESIRNHHSSTKIVIVGSALQINHNHIEMLPHPYSFTKTMQILIARAWEKLFQLDIRIAKPCNLIGPGHSNGVCGLFAEKIAGMEQNNGETVLHVSNPNTERYFLDVRDVVKAYAVLLEKGKKGEVYDIASRESRSLKDVITTFKPLTDIDFQIEYSDVQQQVDDFVVINTDKMSSLGWEPTISFDSSLSDSLNFFRSIKKKEE